MSPESNTTPQFSPNQRVRGIVAHWAATGQRDKVLGVAVALLESGRPEMVAEARVLLAMLGDGQ